MSTTSKADLYRQLPSVDELLRLPDLVELIEREGRTVVTEAARTTLERLRKEIGADSLDAESLQLAVRNIALDIEGELRASLRPSLRRVINATGVILHTNLGRAPLSRVAIDRLAEVATGFSNLEFDLSTGARGKRDVHAQRLFEQLFASVSREGAAVSSVVVNNNAAAVLLVLNALAEGGEVVVSRGELVEIGGSFRIPDVMSKSGGTLREVGTTNRTRIADYERAINERTKMLLRVHRSNFEIVGFTEQPSLEELVALGRKHAIPVVEDLGSGALVDLSQFGIHGEPSVYDSLRAGVDVVTYSGDKLLGGPQAGLISGRPDLIQKIRSNPLFRALRVDKLTYGVLEQVLIAYVKKDYAAIPALAMMAAKPEEIHARAEAIRSKLDSVAGLKCDVVATQSAIGGGAAPGATLPSFALALRANETSATELMSRLRSAETPIIGRIEEDAVLLDLRTVRPEEDDAVARIVETTARS